MRNKDSFKCGCGFEVNADRNAAVNVLAQCERLPSRQVAVGVEE